MYTFGKLRSTMHHFNYRFLIIHIMNYDKEN